MKNCDIFCFGYFIPLLLIFFRRFCYKLLRPLSDMLTGVKNGAIDLAEESLINFIDNWFVKYDSSCIFPEANFCWAFDTSSVGNEIVGLCVKLFFSKKCRYRSSWMIIISRDFYSLVLQRFSKRTYHPGPVEYTGCTSAEWGITLNCIWK